MLTRKLFHNPLLALVAILMLQACNAVQPYYKNEADAPEKAAQLPSGDAAYEVFLIGDTGEPFKEDESDKTVPVITLLGKHLEGAGENSSVVFLGDNVYPRGLPPVEKGEEKSTERLEMERKLNASLDIVKDYKGNPYFIPGNHDWNHNKSGGLEYIISQADYIKDYLGKKNTFLPKDGCPGPEVIQLTEHSVMMIIDTEWWLRDWTREPGINEDCDVHTRDQFLVQLEDAIKNNKEKDILIALHHPIYTQGPHGGYYTLKSHIFPLTDAKKGLYVPLPIIGSIYPLYRMTGGATQDISHPKYRDLIKGLKAAAKLGDRVIFASGHEHGLMHYDVDGEHYIVAGSGSKINPIRTGKKASFAHMSKGFSKLSYYENGEIWMEFWTPVGDGSDGKVIYRKKLEDAITRVEPPKPEYVMPTEKTKTRVTTETYKAGPIKKFLLGKHYREAWGAELEFPIIDLETEKGGLTPIQKGGGMQTKSLRLEAKDKKQYVLRSINKDISAVVPKFLDDTFAEDLLQDQLSTAHPYSALVIPKLAEAAGVYHTNPKIVYLPKQNALGEYAEDFGDDIYLFEERPANETWKEADFFGNPDDIINFSKVIKNLAKNRDHVVDQRQVVKSRLFDILINDWDRHDDQWRWAVNEEEDRTVYAPVPRDRDQAFHHKRSGVLPRLSTIPWGLRKFQSFENNVKSVKGMNFNARWFDRYFTNEMSYDDWVEEAKLIQEGVTDEVIEDAVKSWPQPLYDINGERTIAVLKARRDNLVKIAKRSYKLISRYVDVVATKDDDFIEIERLNNKETRVSLYKRSKKGKKKGGAYYDRIFNKKYTKEVRIYGLKGDDEYKIRGKVEDGLLVRIIGGKGKDKYENTSLSTRSSRNTRIYDEVEKSKIEGEKDIRIVDTKYRPELNEYDRYGFKFDFNLPLIEFGVNVDDGLLLGGGTTFIKQGWKKEPYAASHTVAGKVSFATGAFSFRYVGDYEDFAGTTDLNFEAYINAPNFVRNFFGMGNESIDLRPNDNDFNRVRMDQGIINVFMKKDFSQNHFLQFGPSFQYTKVESDTSRFVSDANPMFGTGQFDALNYLGVGFKYHVNNLDNKALPGRGISFDAGATVNFNLDDQDSRYTRVFSEFSMFYTLTPIKTTIAARVGAAHNFGDFQFFQANTIGGNSNVRGLRAFRYSGRTSFYQNTELRIKLTKISNYVFSSSIGILGHADIGRVWLTNDTSDLWHYGYGGGVWFSIFDLGVLSATYTFSDTDDLFILGVGFFF
ncbi:MAG: BamA/TamA family outer membrane protein [Bacteroidota bacterium]